MLLAMHANPMLARRTDNPAGSCVSTNLGKLAARRSGKEAKGRPIHHEARKADARDGVMTRDSRDRSITAALQPYSYFSRKASTDNCRKSARRVRNVSWSQFHQASSCN